MNNFSILYLLDVIESLGYSDVLTGGHQMAQDWFEDGLNYPQIVHELEARGMLEYGD